MLNEGDGAAEVYGGGDVRLFKVGGGAEIEQKDSASVGVDGENCVEVAWKDHASTAFFGGRSLVC